MAAEHSAIRLLLLEASQNEAERLVSLFRNAGRATRAQRLADPAGLDELLSQPWDLAILAPPSPELDSLSALRQLRRRAPQLAVIQRVPPDDPAAVLDALRLGALEGSPPVTDAISWHAAEVTRVFDHRYPDHRQE